MGLQLPPQLTEPLSWIGLDWPTADEEHLFRLGQGWLELAGTLGTSAQRADQGAQAVWTENSGPAVEAFRKHWEEGGGTKAVRGGQAAVTIIGVGLIVYAAIILFLKISFIVHLIVLLIQVTQAIITAVATFGASLLEIPVFQQIARTAVDTLLNMVLLEIIG
ncbi:hypothetical protein Val02_28410 [Virgisporangium aliadipatigenens]|uniref:Outer membrane channel protein CpnT-like N-terminal domain-containing protein n=1 Tax=Virgisporangium aliadipatigenens TaxID=741659 RepID=A0A8J4DPI1_9ACTN|nr:hypothetical protein [Virgisporangium aliadipatigenens]GIJ45955.1 hypothetical protein Val02_28410 [Virgisporangium aliadipatigenens]